MLSFHHVDSSRLLLCLQAVRRIPVSETEYGSHGLWHRQATSYHHQDSTNQDDRLLSLWRMTFRQTLISAEGWASNAQVHHALQEPLAEVHELLFRFYHL